MTNPRIKVLEDLRKQMERAPSKLPAIVNEAEKAHRLHSASKGRW